jgi:hypothetical protein
MMVKPIGENPPSEAHESESLGGLAFKEKFQNIELLQQLQFALIAADGNGSHEQVVDERVAGMNVGVN